MDLSRYLVAFSVLVIIPTAFTLWAPIHGFPRFWRRFGFFGTYGLLSIPAGGVAAMIVAFRRTLLQIDFGRNSVTQCLGIACLASALWLATHYRQALTFAILAGMPELAPHSSPGRLLTNGIYASIRHPRYAAVMLWLFGSALFTNYLMAYLWCLAGIPGMAALVWLEERELRQRFGAQYIAYCQRVPRFVPVRWGRRSAHE